MVRLDHCDLYVGNKLLASGLSLKTKQSSAIGVLARSGFGKTSLFRALYQVDGYRLDGAVSFNSKDSAYMPQNGGLIPWLTVQENASLFGVKVNEQAPIELGVTELLPRRVTTLSGGEYQRCLLWITLSVEKKTWILDEPLTGSDLLAKKKAIEWMTSQLATQRSSAIVVSHDVELIAEFCDSVFVFDGIGTTVVENVKNMESEELSSILVNIFTTQIKDES